ncbi:MAG: cytochrome c [Ignavibacteriae bacterium]|nr:cytochrome c [Ignavibacteriota bacterium]
MTCISQTLQSAICRPLSIFSLLLLVGCQADDKIQSQIPEISPRRQEAIGERLYQRYCAGCHGTTGEGDGIHSYTLNPPPANHTDSVYMVSLSDEYLFNVISNGGASVSKSPEMPRWKDILNKDEIGNVILYIHTLSKKRLAQEIEEKSP